MSSCQAPSQAHPRLSSSLSQLEETNHSGSSSDEHNHLSLSNTRLNEYASTTSSDTESSQISSKSRTTGASTSQGSPASSPSHSVGYFADSSDVDLDIDDLSQCSELGVDPPSSERGNADDGSLSSSDWAAGEIEGGEDEDEASPKCCRSPVTGYIMEGSDCTDADVTDRHVVPNAKSNDLNEVNDIFCNTCSTVSDGVQSDEMDTPRNTIEFNDCKNRAMDIVPLVDENHISKLPIDTYNNNDSSNLQGLENDSNQHQGTAICVRTSDTENCFVEVPPMNAQDQHGSLEGECPNDTAHRGILIMQNHETNQTSVGDSFSSASANEDTDQASISDSLSSVGAKYSDSFESYSSDDAMPQFMDEVEYGSNVSDTETHIPPLEFPIDMVTPSTSKDSRGTLRPTTLLSGHTKLSNVLTKIVKVFLPHPPSRLAKPAMFNRWNSNLQKPRLGFDIVKGHSTIFSPNYQPKWARYLYRERRERPKKIKSHSDDVLSQMTVMSC